MKNKNISSIEENWLKALYYEYENYGSVREKLSILVDLSNYLEREKEIHEDNNSENSDILLSIKYRTLLIRFLKKLLDIEVKTSLAHIHKHKYKVAIIDLTDLIKEPDYSVVIDNLANFDTKKINSKLLKDYVYEKIDGTYEKGTKKYKETFVESLIKCLNHYDEMYTAYFYKTLFIDELLSAIVNIEKCIIYSYLNMDIKNLKDRM